MQVFDGTNTITLSAQLSTADTVEFEEKSQPKYTDTM